MQGDDFACDNAGKETTNYTDTYEVCQCVGNLKSLCPWLVNFKTSGGLNLDVHCFAELKIVCIILHLDT